MKTTGQKQLKYYVIGAGSIGKRHHQNLLSLGADARLLSWRNISLNDFVTLLGNIPAQRSAVVIATASQVRFDLIQAAANANVPVYIEKPLAFRVSDLDRIYDVAQPIIARSMIGFMMRYHPMITALAGRKHDDIYGFSFEIGHDVRQWRQDWQFKDSYAAKSQGGGVLLDLCHELDIAQLLFPDARLGQVDCLGHSDFENVDFATRISLNQHNGPSGTVAMDYLSPHSIRRINLRGRNAISDIDLLAGTETRSQNGVLHTTQSALERNNMFVDIMRDFMTLAENGQPPENQIAPMMDNVYESCKLIAQAWEARQFHGHISGGMQ